MTDKKSNNQPTKPTIDRSRPATGDLTKSIKNESPDFSVGRSEGPVVTNTLPPPPPPRPKKESE